MHERALCCLLLLLVALLPRCVAAANTSSRSNDELAQRNGDLQIVFFDTCRISIMLHFYECVAS